MSNTNALATTIHAVSPAFNSPSAEASVAASYEVPKNQMAGTNSANTKKLLFRPMSWL